VPLFGDRISKLIVSIRPERVWYLKQENFSLEYFFGQLF